MQSGRSGGRKGGGKRHKRQRVVSAMRIGKRGQGERRDEAHRMILPLSRGAAIALSP